MEALRASLGKKVAAAAPAGKGEKARKGPKRAEAAEPPARKKASKK